MKPRPPEWVDQIARVHYSNRPAVYDIIETRLMETDLSPQELVLARLAIGNYEVQQPNGAIENGKPMDLQTAAKLNGVRLTKAQTQAVGALLSEVVPGVAHAFAPLRHSLLPGDVRPVTDAYVKSPEMGHSLLSGAETEALIYRVAAGRKLADIDNPNEWERGILADAREARDTLVTHNLRLAFTIAKRFVRPGEDMSDYLQVANVALLNAAANVDPEKSRYKKFSTYAGVCIEGALNTFVAKNTPGTNLKDKYYDTARFLRLQYELSETLGRRPTEAELVAGDTSRTLTAEMVHKYRRYAALIHPLDLEEAMPDYRIPEEADDETWYTNLRSALRPIGANETEIKTEHEMLCQALEAVLEALSDREAGIIRMRFGMNADEQPKTFDEIAKVYGVTRERIRQIESKTISKLRHPSLSDHLKDFLAD